MNNSGIQDYGRINNRKSDIIIWQKKNIEICSLPGTIMGRKWVNSIGNIYKKPN